MRTRLTGWFRQLSRRGKLLVSVLILGLLGVLGAIAVYLYSSSLSDSNDYIRRWINDPDSRTELATISRQTCGDAPFILPSDGLIGLLYADPAAPYHIFNRHTGIDIFGDGEPGEVPVYAVYDGYLTRLPDWKSSVIIEHDDPLNPGTTIFTYYTHLAAENGDSYIVDDFPPGTDRIPVEQGTLLGYQGEYNGGSFPIALHVHFSIVKSDANGDFLNESDLDNTLDPSPYFGLPLHIKTVTERPIRCKDR